jgi:hypothetical protein
MAAATVTGLLEAAYTVLEAAVYSLSLSAESRKVFEVYRWPLTSLALKLILQQSDIQGANVTTALSSQSSILICLKKITASIHASILTDRVTEGRMTLEAFLIHIEIL